MLKMHLEGTFPHMVQLLNAGEINQKRGSLFFSNYKVTKELNKDIFDKYLFLLFFLYLRGRF